MNYFNYFTEIEDHFQRVRGTSLFLLSPLDWALIESWNESGVPLEAVLRGIDAAFEKWRGRKVKTQMVNSLAFCAQAVLTEAKIMVTGDLNEEKIHDLLAARAPIDVFGVGTELSTSADAPTLGVVYKLVELETAAGSRHPVKLSHDKQTLPGAKQVFRYADHDLLSRANECPSCPQGAGACVALQRPVIIGGALVEPLPSAADARKRATDSQPIPAGWRVEISAELTALDDNIRRGVSL